MSVHRNVFIFKHFLTVLKTLDNYQLFIINVCLFIIQLFRIPETLDKGFLLWELTNQELDLHIILWRQWAVEGDVYGELLAAADHQQRCVDEVGGVVAPGVPLLLHVDGQHLQSTSI